MGIPDGNTREAVARHVAETYCVRVRETSLPESWNEHVVRVDLHDEPSWIARIFDERRPVAEVEGDAEILRFLESHNYPSERVAHDKPVTVLDGHPVLVTLCVDGEN